MYSSSILKVLRGEPRSYQVWEYSEGTFVDEYQKNIAAVVWDDEQLWDVLQIKTEEVQLKVYLMSSCSAAASYELQHKRHRWTPFLSLSGMRSQEHRDKYNAIAGCGLDEWSLSLREYDPQDPLQKPGARAECQGILSLAEPTSASTERIHSVNERRSKFRAWTHIQDLATLSAWFASKRCTRGHADTLALQGHKPARGDPIAPVPADGQLGPVHVANQPQPRRPSRVTRGAWAWRAFQHTEGEGVWMGGAAGALLSARWHALEPDQREFYYRIGDAAADMWRSGQKAWGQRVHARKRPREPDADPEEYLDAAALQTAPGRRRLPKAVQESSIYKAAVLEREECHRRQVFKGPCSFGVGANRMRPRPCH